MTEKIQTKTGKGRLPVNRGGKNVRIAFNKCVYKPYRIDITHSFVSSLKNISNADKQFMASFDIENLFINIPVSKPII